MIGYAYRATRAQGDMLVATPIRTTARGVVDFESTFGLSVGVMASEMPMMTHHYWMAWRCSSSGIPFEQWLDELRDFEVVTDGDSASDSAGDGGS